jgi:hypothetical protein
MELVTTALLKNFKSSLINKSIIRRYVDSAPRASLNNQLKSQETLTPTTLISRYATWANTRLVNDLICCLC